MNNSSCNLPDSRYLSLAVCILCVCVRICVLKLKKLQFWEKLLGTKSLHLSCRVKAHISHSEHKVSLRHLLSFAACLKNDILNTAAVIWIRATAMMNASDDSSYQEEVMLGNSTWAYSYYHQNYTLSPPLLPDKSSTSKPAACEQLHIAVEVQTKCGTEHQTA